MFLVCVRLVVVQRKERVDVKLVILSGVLGPCGCRLGLLGCGRDG